jgi:site-specific recombinase XerD
MMEPIQIKQFCAHLQTRNYSPHTVENYGRDLRLFFAELDKELRQVSWRDVDHFVQQQARAELAATTINRRLNALKHFFDYLVIEQQVLGVNPVKPSHFLRRGRPLPKKLSQAQVKQLFAQINNPMDHALCLLMLRCGLRVSEVAKLKLSHIDWEQQSLLVEQGKGRKDRVVYLSTDALAALQHCLKLRPTSVPNELFFWNQKRANRALSRKGIQKKVERYAKAAGLKASCHSLRHTFASNLLEEGAEVISIKELLGHSSIESSERYAKLSNQRVKQMYLHTIKKVIDKTRV